MCAYTILLHVVLYLFRLYHTGTDRRFTRRLTRIVPTAGEARMLKGDESL